MINNTWIRQHLYVCCKQFYMHIKISPGWRLAWHTWELGVGISRDIGWNHENPHGFSIWIKFWLDIMVGFGNKHGLMVVSQRSSQPLAHWPYWSLSQGRSTAMSERFGDALVTWRLTNVRKASFWTVGACSTHLSKSCSMALCNLRSPSFTLSPFHQLSLAITWVAMAEAIPKIRLLQSADQRLMRFNISKGHMEGLTVANKKGMWTILLTFRCILTMLRPSVL